MGAHGPPDDETVAAAAAVRLDAGASARDVATELAARFGRPRREVYAVVTEVVESRTNTQAGTDSDRD